MCIRDRYIPASAGFPAIRTSGYNGEGFGMYYLRGGINSGCVPPDFESVVFVDQFVHDANYVLSESMVFEIGVIRDGRSRDDGTKSNPIGYGTHRVGRLAARADRPVAGRDLC